jgi:hypothetical protein
MANTSIHGLSFNSSNQSAFSVFPDQCINLPVTNSFFTINDLWTLIYTDTARDLAPFFIGPVPSASLVTIMSKACI